ncbi:MAG TPA: metallophosphoesterase family protein, partial [Vicinamibacterales bacterium]|nr:metallophosphoesterase family protein [Vicinamibacterales bacterium]
IRSPRLKVLLLVLVLALLVLLLPLRRNSGAPQQIHLSWEGPSSDLVTVLWATKTVSSRSRARFGSSPALESGSVEAQAIPGPVHSRQHLHRAVLGPLLAGVTYFYQVGDDATGWSSLLRLTTAPLPGAGLTFVAAADMGQGRAAVANVERMAEAHPAFALHLGDLSYAEGDAEDWDTWFRKIEPLASLAPYMTAIGNHEYEQGTGLSAYLERLALPNNERYYSFDCGLLHVVVLDSGASYAAPSTAMTEWLENDLNASARDPEHPWIVVGFHFPPYSSGEYGSWEEGRAAWSPQFDRHGVALVLSGHMHAYERSWPVDARGAVARRDYRDPGAPVYVVTGGAGRHGRLHQFPGPAPDWSAFRAVAQHTLRVTVDKTRMSIMAIRPNGDVLDSFSITRGS